VLDLCNALGRSALRRLNRISTWLVVVATLALALVLASSAVALLDIPQAQPGRVLGSRCGPSRCTVDTQAETALDTAFSVEGAIAYVTGIIRADGTWVPYDFVVFRGGVRAAAGADPAPGGSLSGESGRVLGPRLDARVRTPAGARAGRTRSHSRSAGRCRHVSFVASKLGVGDAGRAILLYYARARAWPARRQLPRSSLHRADGRGWAVAGCA